MARQRKRGGWVSAGRGSGRVARDHTPAPGSLAVLGLCALALSGCSGEEATRVSLPVHVEASDLAPVETDRGYTVELSEARLVVSDLKFAIAGEEHARSGWRRVSDWFIPVAHAHPGHYVGGDVTGELLGHFVTSWLPEAPAPLGVATLLEGDYQSASFAFARATTADGLPEGDLLIGHTALLRGVAARAGEQRDFLIRLDAVDGEELVGLPFEAGVRAGQPQAIGFELVPENPLERATLFDAVDFARLPLGADGLVHIDSDAVDPAVIAAYARVRAAFQGASHFRMRGVLR